MIVEIRELAEKSDNPKHLSTSYFMHAMQIFMGTLSSNQKLEISDADEIIMKLKKALEISENINDLKGQITTKNMLSLLYGVLKDHKKAIEIQKEIIDIEEIINPQNGAIKTYHQLVLIYSRMGDYTNAIKYVNNKGIEKIKYHNATTIDVALILAEFSFVSPNGKVVLSIKIFMQIIKTNIPPI